MGVMAVPMLFAAAAAGVSAYNTNRTEKKKDRALAEKIRTQGKKQQEADAKVNAALDGMAGSNPARDRASALSEYVAQVRANQGNVNTLGAQTGRVSDAYAQAANDAALGVNTEVADTAGLMATQDGATRQRQREGRDQARLGTDIGLVRREADGLAYLDDMRIAGIRRNPWLDAASAVLGAMGGGMGAGAGAGAAGSMAGASSGLGSVAGIGAGLAGGSRYAPKAGVADPFAKYGRAS
jgi:hypothetical protein